MGRLELEDPLGERKIGGLILGPGAERRARRRDRGDRLGYVRAVLGACHG